MTTTIYNTSTETFRERVQKEFPDELRTKPKARRKNQDDGWNLQDLHPPGWFSKSLGADSINSTLSYSGDSDYFKWVSFDKKWKDGSGNKADGTKRRVKSYHDYQTLLSLVCPQLFGIWRDGNHILQIHMEKMRSESILIERSLQLSELSAYLYQQTTQTYMFVQDTSLQLVKEVFNPHSWHSSREHLREYVNISWEEVMYYLPQIPSEDSGVGVYLPYQTKYGRWEPHLSVYEIASLNQKPHEVLIESLVDLVDTPPLSEEEFTSLCDLHNYKTDKPSGRVATLNKNLSEYGIAITKTRVRDGKDRVNVYQIHYRRVNLTVQPIDKSSLQKSLGVIPLI